MWLLGKLVEGIESLWGLFDTRLKRIVFHILTGCVNLWLIWVGFHMESGWRWPLILFNGLFIYTHAIFLREYFEDIQWSDWFKSSPHRRALDACEQGDLKTLEELHATLPDWDWSGFSSTALKEPHRFAQTPLELALRSNQLHVAAWLIDHGVHCTLPDWKEFQWVRELLKHQSGSTYHISQSSLDGKMYATFMRWFHWYYLNSPGFMPFLESLYHRFQHQGKATPTLLKWVTLLGQSASQQEATAFYDHFKKLGAFASSYMPKDLFKAIEDVDGFHDSTWLLTLVRADLEKETLQALPKAQGTHHDKRL